MLTVTTYILSNIYGIDGNWIYLATVVFDWIILGLIEKVINRKWR